MAAEHKSRTLNSDFGDMMQFLKLSLDSRIVLVAVVTKFRDDFN